METLNKTTRILKSYPVVICCLFFGVESLAGKISPPQNVSLKWSKDFHLQLSWTPPSHSMESCRYKVFTKSKENSDVIETVSIPSWSDFIVMDGGYLELSVKTVCGGNESDPVSFKLNSELVERLQCFIQSSKLTYCTWHNPNKAADLRFFYWFESKNNKPVECSEYKYSGGIRTGCDLRANTNLEMFIVFNGTLDNKPRVQQVRNTFKIWLRNFVKPLALNWTVEKVENAFIINWIPPDVFRLDQWKFPINYTECDKPKLLKEGKGTSYKLPRLPHCQYKISIQAKESDSNKSPWSEVKIFDADTDSNASIYALIVIPLMFAGLAALTFVCCRKNKENIFPKIPEPRDLFSENNNNKSIVHNLYIPAEEEEHCKITLVMEPQTDKLYS